MRAMGRTINTTKPTKTPMVKMPVARVPKVRVPGGAGLSVPPFNNRVQMQSTMTGFPGATAPMAFPASGKMAF